MKCNLWVSRWSFVVVVILSAFTAFYVQRKILIIKIVSFNICCEQFEKFPPPNDLTIPTTPRYRPNTWLRSPRRLSYSVPEARTLKFSHPANKQIACSVLPSTYKRTKTLETHTQKGSPVTDNTEAHKGNTRFPDREKELQPQDHTKALNNSIAKDEIEEDRATGPWLKVGKNYCIENPTREKVITQTTKENICSREGESV